MKFICYMIMLNFAVYHNSYGGQVTEIYPGSLLKKELTAIHSNPFIKVRFWGILDGELAFEFKEFDRLIFEEKPIFEKLKVVREKDDFNDSGQQELIPGETIMGQPEIREEIIELGPLVQENFRYFDVIYRTDNNGILVDREQVILGQFENLRDQSVRIQFKSDTVKIPELELTRKELYSQFGIRYDIVKKSHPENLKFEARWNKSSYAPGEVAELDIIVENSGNPEENIFRLLARSISRWPWLDGKMYYLGDLKAGEKKQLLRIFRIPINIPHGFYCMRIGFNDHSGAKPQLPLTIEIHN